MDSRAKRLVEIGDKLFSAQQPWNNLRQEIAELFYPMRSDFTQTLGIGTDFQTGLMDSYPVQARETLGNMPYAMVRQGDWFSVSTGDNELDELPENMAWFEKAKEVMRNTMYAPPANFVSATVEGDHDYVTFGNAILSIEENASRNGLIYKAHHPRDNVWMSNADGKIDHNQRAISMTARNVCRNKRWSVHADVEKMGREEPNKTIKLRHILMPVDDIYGDDKTMRRKYANKPFLSLYVDVERNHLLGESGMPMFNYVIPGWRKLSNVMYAFSPATLNCLPDSRMLQDLSRIILEQGEKAIDPPTMGRGDIFRDAINLYAGGHTNVDIEADQDIRDAFMVLENKGQLGFGLDMRQDVRQLIAESMLMNKLFLPSTKDMTAFETNARLDELRRAALPFFGPYDSECNLPLCDVTFESLLNARAIPNPPDKLRDRDLTFKFDGPLNTLEGRQIIAAFQESVSLVAAGAQFDQTLPKKFNLTQATKDAVRGTGAKADWIIDEEVEAEVDEQDAQAAQLAKAAEIANAGAVTAKNVGEGAQALQLAGIV